MIDMIWLYIFLGLAYIVGAVGYFKYKILKRRLKEVLQREEDKLKAFRNNTRDFKSDHEWVVCADCKLSILRKLKEKLL